MMSDIVERVTSTIGGWVTSDSLFSCAVGVLTGSWS